MFKKDQGGGGGAKVLIKRMAMDVLVSPNSCLHPILSYGNSSQQLPSPIQYFTAVILKELTLSNLESTKIKIKFMAYWVFSYLWYAVFLTSLCNME